MAKLSPPPKGFDEAKLSQMIEPLTVRIEKIRGATRTPIPMPILDEGGQGGGSGFTQSLVRDLENWLVTEWAGGGYYEITVTDSSAPALVMRWNPAWDVKTYPELIPPPLQGMMEQRTVPAPQGNNMSQFPVVLPGGGIPLYAPQSQPQPQQQAYYAHPLPMPPPPMPGSHQWGAYSQEAERRERDNEMRRLREQSESHARDALAAKHAADLERERQANEARNAAHATQISELRTMISGLAQAMQAPKANAEIDALRAEHRRTEERLERERSEREAERREAAVKDMIRGMAENSQRQIDALMQMMTAQKQNQPDQFLMMWQQNNREQMELAKELSRNQTTQMQQLQMYMMKPQDIMSMARESTTSVDSAIERSTNFFGRVIDTQQKVTENLLQMQPQGNGVVDLVGGTVEKAGNALEKYLTGKQMSVQIEHQSQVAIAEAQARAYAAAASMQAAQSAQPSAPPMQAPAGFASPPTEAASSPMDQAANGEAKVETKRLGRTDTEWFGPIMPQVNEVRRRAGEWIKSIALKRLDKKTGQPIGLNPQEATEGILQAVSICVQKQIPIPAMMDLLFQQRHADFVDVLLPNVSQPYRDDVTQLLIQAERRFRNQPDPNGPVEPPQAQAEPEGESEPKPGPGDPNEDDADDDTSDDDSDDTDGDDTSDEPEGDKAQDGRVISKPTLVPSPAPARSTATTPASTRRVLPRTTH